MEDPGISRDCQISSNCKHEMEGTKQSFLFQFIMNDRIIPRWIYTECPNSNPHPKVDFARIITTNQEYYKNDI